MYFEYNSKELKDEQNFSDNRLHIIFGAWPSMYFVNVIFFKVIILYNWRPGSDSHEGL